MFRNCYNLEYFNISNFDVKNVKRMFRMFDSCYSLISLNLSNFETDNLLEASYFLHECLLLENLDLRKFNTLKLKNYTDFFQDKPTGVTLIYNKTIFNLSIPKDWNATDINTDDI